MKVEYVNTEFESIMQIDFLFIEDNKVFREKHEVERIEVDKHHYILVTTAGEWLYYDIKAIKEVTIQSLIRSSYKDQSPFEFSREILKELSEIEEEGALELPF